MGLDMYLDINLYLPTAFDKHKPAHRAVSVEALTMPKIDTTGPYPDVGYVTDLTIRVAYWRKANHIHHWFVTNIQDGIDECQTSDMPRSQVVELLATVTHVLSAQSVDIAADRLPPTEGFFFGDYQIPPYNEDREAWDYWSDLRDTAKQLSNALRIYDELEAQEPKVWLSFQYHASW